jgi:hypothetical protein
VVAGAKICKLRDANIAAQFYGGQIVDPGIFTKPAMITYAQVPRILHPESRFDYHSFTYGSTE